MFLYSKFFSKEKEKQNKEKQNKEKQNKEKQNKEKQNNNYFLIPQELSNEREMEMISQLAKKIVKSGMEAPAGFLLEVIKPLSFPMSQIGLTLITPFLELVGINGYEYVTLFSDYKNVERLIDKIEEIRDSEEKQNQ